MPTPHACYRCGGVLSLEHQTERTPPPDPEYYDPAPLPYSPVFVCPRCNVSWLALQGNSVSIQYPAFGAAGLEYHPV
jgi:hypothetical protein